MEQIKIRDIFGEEVLIIANKDSIKIVHNKRKAVVSMAYLIASGLHERFKKVIFVKFRNGFKKEVVDDKKILLHLAGCLCVLNRRKTHKLLVFYPTELDYIRKSLI